MKKSSALLAVLAGLAFASCGHAAMADEIAKINYNYAKQLHAVAAIQKDHQSKMAAIQPHFPKAQLERDRRISEHEHHQRAVMRAMRTMR